jgi:hypothetical protein
MKVNKDDISEIVSIDSGDSNFIEQLNNLDLLSTRTFSSCYIFYMRKNQSDAKLILDNIVIYLKYSTTTKKSFLLIDFFLHIQKKSIERCLSTRFKLLLVSSIPWYDRRRLESNKL